MPVMFPQLLFLEVAINVPFRIMADDLGLHCLQIAYIYFSHFSGGIS